MIHIYLKNLIKYMKQEKFISVFFRFICLMISIRNYYIDTIIYTFIRVSNNKYSKIRVNNSFLNISFDDKGLSKDLLIHKKREKFSTDFLKLIIQKNEIIIDIGANIGYYALLESQLASNGKVFAMEPVPESFSLLDKNIKLNECKNIDAYKMAISDISGKSKMYVYDKRNRCSFIKDPSGNIINEVEVPIMTLDQFVESHVNQYPTLIRMDLEGYEFQVIKGAHNILNNNRPLKLVIELHPQLMSIERMMYILDTLKQANFKIEEIINDPEASDYRSINTLNSLFRKIGIPLYGYSGKGYETLDLFLKNGLASNVFFKRD